MQRGRQAAEDTRQHGHEQGESQHGPVEGDLGLVRNRVGRNEGEDRRKPRVGQRGADHRRHQRQEQALGQKLPHEPRAARAERRSHAHLPLPDAGSRQHQIRDVHARDQQKDRDGAEQDPHVPLDPARERLREGQNPNAKVVRKLGWFARLEIRDDRPEIGFRLRVGDARFQPPQQMDGSHALDPASPLEDDGDINVGAAPHESLGHDADHRAAGVVQLQLATQHVRVAGKLALPEPIAEDDHRRCARPGVFGGRRPAEQRRHAHHVERIEGAVVAAQPLRVALADPEHVADRRRDDTGCSAEDRVPLGELDELIDRVSRPIAAHRSIRDADAHQAIDVFVRKGIQHDPVKDAVDRGGGHDAHRERQDRYGRETRILDETARRESQVTEGLIEPVQHGRTPAPDDAPGARCSRASGIPGSPRRRPEVAGTRSRGDCAAALGGSIRIPVLRP